MTRAKRVALWASIFSVLYFLALFSYIPVLFIDAETAQEILPVVPWWLLVSFGSYALWSLGHGLYTFRECTDAYEELLKEITEAKTELRTKGVSVD
ncbi:dolichol-phosphate mannosyltransferase subunit 3 [Dentipellis sp. KUC8613]|nr:dolichol-phosphate mannosyltransferase subunit 3 [Dentipellis sp. KUC8613]